MTVAAATPAWVKRDATLLTRERMAMQHARSEHELPELEVSAELRFALVSCLSDAVFTEDPLRLMRVVAWVDAREEIDRRIAAASPEARGRCLECVLTAARLDDCSDVDAALAELAQELELETAQASGHAAAQLCRAAQSRLSHAGLPGGVRARLGRTIADLTREDGASPEMLMGLAGTLETVAISLEQPLPDGPLVARQAVVVLDQALHDRLDLLERQAAWLKDCEDPWTHPEALASLRAMEHAAMVRRHLAAISSRINVQGMSEGQRKRLVEVAQRIRRSEDVGADHGWVMSQTVEFASADLIGEALTAAGWPGTDSMAQFHWRPAGAMAHPVGRLHNALRAVEHARDEGDVEGGRAARAQARAAARDILRLSGRK